MIRVNLLQPRISAVPDAPRPAARARKRPMFISGYEAALGVVLLAGGATAMFFYFDGSVDGEDPRQAPPVVAVAPDESSADPADVDEPAETAPDAANAAPSDSPAASEPVEAEPAAEPPTDVAKRPPPATPAPSTSASSPLRLSNLNIANRNGDLKMTLTLSGRPSYNKFQLNTPNRIVIDIANARVGLRRSNLVQNVDHPLVRRVRVGQFAQDPWVTRLVLDVTQFPNLLLFPHSGGLDIQVSKSGQ